MRVIFLSLSILIVLAGSGQVTQLNTGTTANLADLSVINKNIIICGFFNYLVKSGDECETLIPMPLPGPSSYGNRLVRKDSNNLYLLSYTPNQTLIYKSTDGGANWTQKLDTIGHYGCYMDFFDGSEGFYSDGTSIVKTKDGGDTWVSGYSFYSAGLLGISVIKTYGDSMVFVGGSNLYNGSIFLSKDRGQTWPTSLAGGTAGDAPVDFFFLNKDTIFCSAFSKFGGSLALTMNGGQTWTDNTSLPLFQPHGINFKSVKEGYVVGSNTQTIGTIFRTTDFGKTWSEFNTGIKTHFFHIAFLNDSVALLSGTNGVLLKWNYKRSVFTSLGENHFDNARLKIFPNPVSDKLHFEFENILPGLELKITNTLGQLVYSKQNVDLQEDLEASFLKAGVYYLKLENDEGQKVFKIIKE
jgi:photosystem II stability/assembly factor-like uncharacterized protein